jgi:uncharacterized membrane protein
MSQASHSVTVDVPLRVAYAQWTQMEEFPRFMQGVDEVRQVTDTLLRWTVTVQGVRREFDAVITQQVPDEVLAWSTMQGPRQAGTVRFRPASADRTDVSLELTFEPEGMVEHAGDLLGFVQRQVRDDLERFKAYIESRGAASGRWDGTISDGVPAGDGTLPADDPALGTGPAGPDPDAFG